MEQEVGERTRRRVAEGVGYLVTIEGEDSLVFHGEDYRESVTVLDDALGFVLKDKFDQARADQTVVVYIGGDSSPVQLIVERRRLRVVTAGIGGQS